MHVEICACIFTSSCVVCCIYIFMNARPHLPNSGEETSCAVWMCGESCNATFQVCMYVYINAPRLWIYVLQECTLLDSHTRVCISTNGHIQLSQWKKGNMGSAIAFAGHVLTCAMHPVDRRDAMKTRNSWGRTPFCELKTNFVGTSVRSSPTLHAKKSPTTNKLARASRDNIASDAKLVKQVHKSATDFGKLKGA